MKLILAIGVLLAVMALPAPVEAASTRCRDTLHGYTCEGVRGYEVRCRYTLHGVSCEDDRGGEVRCRDGLLGRTCEERRRRR